MIGSPAPTVTCISTQISQKKRDLHENRLVKELIENPHRRDLCRDPYNKPILIWETSVGTHTTIKSLQTIKPLSARPYESCKNVLGPACRYDSFFGSLYLRSLRRSLLWVRD